jgi:hypothetical protein
MSDDEMARAVQRLVDRQDIWDCLMRYSRGVDRLDRDILRSVYHEDAVDDHGMFVGSPEEFADWVVAMHDSAHLSHQHCLFNHSCDLDGDVAHTETYYMFAGMNREGTPLSCSGGRYLDRFERRNGRWAIAARVCVRDWAPLDTPPDPEDPSTMTAIRSALPDAVLEFMRGGPLPTRDRGDPSYDRPLSVDPDRVSAGRALRG